VLSEGELVVVGAVIEEEEEEEEEKEEEKEEEGSSLSWLSCASRAAWRAMRSSITIP